MTRDEAIREIALLFAKRRTGGEVYMDGRHNPTPAEMRCAEEAYIIAVGPPPAPASVERCPSCGSDDPKRAILTAVCAWTGVECDNEAFHNTPPREGSAP